MLFLESEEEIPVQFGVMTNQLQICNWLVLHPSVLHLANKMLEASTKQPSTNLPLTTSTSSSSDNVKSISYFGLDIDIVTLLHSYRLRTIVITELLMYY